MIQRPFVAGLSCVLSLSLLLPPAAVAQDSSQSSATFTSNAELVLVPVQVLDGGQPLRGLKQDNFVLLSDDKPQKIAIFEEVQRQPTIPHPGDLLRVSSTPPAPATTFSNVPAGGMPRESLVLAVDLVNTSPYLQRWTIQQILKYLHNTASQIPTAIVAITSFGLLEFQGFTTDNTDLINAANKIGPHIGAADFEHSPALHISFTSPGTFAPTMAAIASTFGRDINYAASAVYTSLRSLDEIAWAYAGVPGRKTVVWFTSGFPVLEEYPEPPPLFGKAKGTMLEPSTSSRHFGKHLSPLYQRTFTALSAANVVLYPVDVTAFAEDRQWDIWESLVQGVPCYGAIPMYTRYRGGWTSCASSGGGWLDRIGLKEIASATAGKYCDAGNHIDHCVNAAVAESAGYYLLGFYVPQPGRQVGFHELKVNVNVAHGEVRTRAGYYLSAPGAPKVDRGLDMDRAINAAVEYTGLPFKVEPGTRPAGSNLPVVFKISFPPSSIVLVPGEDKLSFDVIAAPLSDHGTPLHDTARIVNIDIPPDKLNIALTKGWSLVDSVPVNNRAAAVKVVVRDNNTGKIGSVVIPVPGGGAAL